MTTEAPAKPSNKQQVLTRIEEAIDAYPEWCEEGKLRATMIMRHGKPFKVIFEEETSRII